MKRKRFSFVIICLVTMLALAVPHLGVGAEPADVDWETVELEELPAGVARWVQAHHRQHGVHVLPAGEVRYVLVAWGEKPTGGYSLNVSHVTKSHLGTIDVVCELSVPDPDEMVTQALTYPYQVIALDAGNETIVVNFLGDSWLGDALGQPSEDDADVVMKANLGDGDVAPNPLVVWGRARVYEATLELVVEDGHYHLSKDTITVSTGAPDWAEFAVVITLDAYTSAAGSIIAQVEDVKDGEIHEVSTIPITFGTVSLPFEDLAGHWAEASIRTAIRSGIIHGYPDGTFAPEGMVTRAEFFKMLVASQLDGQEPNDSDTEIPFEDAKDHWVRDYLRWALDEGWLPEMDFYGMNIGPDEIITRQEMAMVIALVAALEATDEPLDFTDAAAIDSDLAAYVAAAVEHSLLLGYPDGSFRPHAGLTRAEAVTVVWRTAWYLQADPEKPSAPSLGFRYDFADGKQGWQGDFTDLPADYEEDLYRLEFGWAPLPEELERDEHALRIGGSNASDDLFMYVRKGLTAADGIEANTTYRITFQVELATNAPAGAVGIGGPPGEAVWVKVGAAPFEPVPMVEEAMGIPYILPTVDKGRQNDDGEHAIRIGDVAKVECDEFDVYELKTLDNRDQIFEMTSDSEGNLWIFVGTDSGFEGRTVLYYNQIMVNLEKVE